MVEQLQANINSKNDNNPQQATPISTAKNDNNADLVDFTACKAKNSNNSQWADK